MATASCVRAYENLDLHYYRVRYWTKWICTFWGAVVGFMALVILIGVGKKLFGVSVLLWLWRFAKEDEHFWLEQFD